jgi:ABC-type glycerol-3-phosphate transport system permease component
VSRLHEAAAYAESQTAHGRVRFYIALVMLTVLTLACATVAVVSILADDLPEADQRVAVGLAGTVVSASLALWMVRTFSKRHKDVQHEAQVMNATSGSRSSSSAPWASSVSGSGRSRSATQATAR